MGGEQGLAQQTVLRKLFLEWERSHTDVHTVHVQLCELLRGHTCVASAGPDRGHFQLPRKPPVPHAQSGAPKANHLLTSITMPWICLFMNFITGTQTQCILL